MPDGESGFRVEGGAFVTDKAVRHGTLIFDHEDAAQMGEEQMEGGEFVSNHDRDISAFAGVVTDVEVERFEMEEGVRGLEGEFQQGEEATRISFGADLIESAPGFEKVVESIRSRVDAGIIPEVSVSVSGESLELVIVTNDRGEEIDWATRLVGLSFNHIGHVDQGAFGPDDGVGIFDVEDQRGVADLSLELEDRSEPVPAKANIVVDNMENLRQDFSEKHGFDPLDDSPELSDIIDDEDMDSMDEPDDSTLKSLGKKVYTALSGTPYDEVYGEDLALAVPQNPEGGSGEGAEGTWDADEHASLSAIADFVDTDADSWEDFSEEDKTQGSQVFADRTDSFSDNFDDDVNLSHHFTQGENAGEASLNGVRNALSRLPQTENLHSDQDAVESHLNGHLPDEEQRLWNRYLHGDFTLEDVIIHSDFTFRDIGLMKDRYEEDFHALAESGKLANDTRSLDEYQDLYETAGESLSDPSEGEGDEMSDSNESGEEGSNGPTRVEQLEERIEELEDQLEEARGGVDEDVDVEELQELLQEARQEREEERENLRERILLKFNLSEEDLAPFESKEQLKALYETLSKSEPNHIGLPAENEEPEELERLEEREEERQEWLEKRQQKSSALAADTGGV